MNKHILFFILFFLMKTISLYSQQENFRPVRASLFLAHQARDRLEKRFFIKVRQDYKESLSCKIKFTYFKIIDQKLSSKRNFSKNFYLLPTKAFNKVLYYPLDLNLKKNEKFYLINAPLVNCREIKKSFILPKSLCEEFDEAIILRDELCPYLAEKSLYPYHKRGYYLGSCACP